MSTNFRYTVVKTIRPYVKFFPQLTKPVMRVLIQVSFHYIESSKCSPEVLDLALNKLTHAGHTIPENFCELFAAILQIMQIFLRTPVKQDELKDCLKQDLRFSDECVEDLAKVLHNHRSSLTKNFIEAKMLRSCAKNLQWRINISLTQGIPRGPSSSSASKKTAGGGVAVVTPTIILHFQLSDGRYRTLELPLAMFHRLRYNIAVLLSEMQSLQQRAVMKKF
ncbi:COMM domain-containing protein 5 [Stomoxys calcitrans]|uniref:COMM domain-containing protein 5 n=1 Tax=Stomoxys calcitrans TaxID=35570 RepID=A0A1I8PIM7_STOCA|nr:COMM domain-containing protein 5 [Stomoxys calcitrans]